MMPALREAEFFSATTDLWTSANSDPYMTLTVHFIDKEWSLQAFCLETVPMFVDHTGQNIADAIADIFENWVSLHSPLTSGVTQPCCVSLCCCCCCHILTHVFSCLHAYIMQRHSSRHLVSFTFLLRVHY